ncbi:hypothetical protein D3C84_820330 [compost metagenome]
MLTTVTQHGVADKTLADTVGYHIAQVLFQNHALAEQLAGVGPGEDGVELVETFDHFLAASGAGVHRLETDRTVVEQVFGRGSRIVESKHAEAIEHHVAHPLGKQR